MNSTEPEKTSLGTNPLPGKVVKSLYRCPNCTAEVEKESTECPQCHTLLFFESTTAEERLRKIEKYHLGQLLLREKEYLFESIHREDRLEEKIKYYSVHAVFFACVYGAVLGCFGDFPQVFASAAKVPLLLFATLLICLPALFTFNIILGSKLSLKQTLAILLASNYLIAIILISLSPIVFLFVLTAGRHDFISLMNVGSFTIAGLAGVRLLWRGMKYLSWRSGAEPNFSLLFVWSIIYMFVGTQLAWRLRPFVGSPGEFAFFRRIEGNFYLALWDLILGLFQ